MEIAGRILVNGSKTIPLMTTASLRILLSSVMVITGLTQSQRGRLIFNCRCFEQQLAMALPRMLGSFSTFQIYFGVVVILDVPDRLLASARACGCSGVYDIMHARTRRPDHPHSRPIRLRPRPQQKPTSKEANLDAKSYDLANGGKKGWDKHGKPESKQGSELDGAGVGDDATDNDVTVSERARAVITRLQCKDGKIGCV